MSNYLHKSFEKALQTAFSEGSTEIIHRYNGSDYSITPENFRDLPNSVKQSFATRFKSSGGGSGGSGEGEGDSNSNGKKTQKGDGGGNVPLDSLFGDNYEEEDFFSDEIGTGKDKTQNDSINSFELIKKEIKKIATTEVKVYEKLDYPRVFKKLLSEPHLAFEEKKVSYETKTELIVFVDRAVGYNGNDKGFHNTLIKACQSIKGVETYDTVRLYDPKSRCYYSTVLSKMPASKHHIPVLVFSQGCGGTSLESILQIPKNFKVTYVTHFNKDCNCGCNTIGVHEQVSRTNKNIKVIYSIDTPSKIVSLREQLIKNN